MQSTRTSVTGSLEFTFKFELSGTSPRPLAWGGKGTYLPDALTFTLVARSLEDNARPRYKDLTLNDVSLSGPKLKKDGTTGTVRHREPFYTFTKDRPLWVDELVSQAVAELQEH